MRRGIACAAFVTALVWAGSAAGATLCVPNVNIPACHGSGANEPTISDAVNNGTDGDTVFVGAGTYAESVEDTSKKLTFVGAGVGRTVIQGKGSPAMEVASGSSVSNLTINLYNAPGETGLQLAGSATNVAVTATGTLSATNPIGVALDQGTFTRGTVTLPVAGSDTNHYAGVVGPGRLSDSSVTAPVGIADSGGIIVSPGMPTTHRVRITANQGVQVGAFGFAIDDSIIRTRPGAQPEIGIGISSNDMFGTYTVRHVDLIGSGAAGSTGVSGYSIGLTLAAVTSVLLESSIVRGYDTSISAVADGTGISASTTVTVRHTFYSGHTSVTEKNNGVAAISPDSHSGNFDPLFVNVAAGDLHLQAGSPAIDHGATALALGESSTDLDGHPRLVVGHRGDAAISDVGAYEFTPHAPSVQARASRRRAPGGRPITFAASGSDPTPGDRVSFAWTFDDGAKAAGATLSHAFVRQGRHIATVTATDLDGFTASATVHITITGPGLSKLKLRPRRVRAGHKLTLRYRDSQVAKTTFKVFRMGSKKPLLTFTHKDHAGTNRLRFKAEHLAPGRYRVRAIPHNRAGSGRAVSVRFRVV